MSLLALILGLALAAVAQPAEVPIKLELSPKNPEVGLVMELRLVMEGAQAADARLVEIPEVEGARLTFVGGPDVVQNQTRVNGRRTQWVRATWRVELVPERDGSIELPPFVFEARGDRVLSPLASFDVGPTPFDSDALSLELEVSTEQLYVGEMVEVEIRASILESLFDQQVPNGVRINVPWLDELASFHRRPASVPGATVLQPIYPSGVQLPVRVYRETRGGQDRIVIATAVPLVATEPGVTEFELSRVGVRVATETRNQRSLLGNRTIATRIVEVASESNGMSLDVRPTPAAGRPDGYTNAVGAFVLDATAAPLALAVGESCRLELRLRRAPGRPEGNLELLDWPAFEEALGDFRIFGKEETNDDTERRLSFEISPRRDDVREIPALSLASFDPRAERYELASTAALPLDVTPGGGDALASMASRDERRDDLESIRVTLPAPRSTLPVWVLPLLLGGVALVAADSIQRRRRWLGTHAELLRRRGAGRELEEQLRASDDAAGVASAFARYLAARMNGPEAGFTAEEASRRLAADGHAELAGDLSATMQGWEAAYLGGGRLDAETVRGEARELAGRVERLS